MPNYREHRLSGWAWAPHQRGPHVAVKHFPHQSHVAAQALAVHKGSQLGVRVRCRAGGGQERGGRGVGVGVGVGLGWGHRKCVMSN